MALKTTGLKKRKKKVPPSLVRKPRRPPKYVTGPEWGEIVGPAPKKPPRKKKKPPVYKPRPPIPPKKPVPGKPKPRPPIPPKGPGKPPKRPGPAPHRPGPPPKGTKPGKPNFGGYVSRHADLAKAFKKHKAKGGTGTAASWGKAHYEKYGKKEKRKLS